MTSKKLLWTASAAILAFPIMTASAVFAQSGPADASSAEEPAFVS